MSEIPAHPKKMVIITTPHGKPSPWEEWAKHNGYEIEYQELSALTIEGHEGHVIVMDSLGLYEAPLKPGQILLDELVHDPFVGYLAEQVIKIQDHAPHHDGVVLKPSMPRKKGPPKRHGHRKGNKADRWR